MKTVRRAFLLATLGQYLGLVASALTIAAMSRLLSPADVGLGVIGLSVTTIVFSLREFATSDFLIQLDRVERSDVRTAFTVMMTISGILALTMVVFLPWIAGFYRAAALESFLLWTILSAIIDGATMPVQAMMRRDMAFGALTVIRVIGAGATTVSTVLLAWLGWGFMSFAFGILVGSVASAFFTIILRPHEWTILPSLKALPAMIEFGRYKGAAYVIERAYEALPQMIIGRLMPSSAVGIYNRATVISSLPDRILLSTVFSVAFPALAAEVRNGRTVKGPYLRAISYITVVYWPALLMVAILADPIVYIFLGSAWGEVVPIVRLLAIASLFWFPVVLTNPLLVAMGANRAAFLCGVISRSASALILCSSSMFGLLAIAYSQYISLPFQMLVALYFVHRLIRFTWLQFLHAILPSAIVSILAIAGPLGLVVWRGFRFDFSVSEALLAALLSVIGWAFGLLIAQHPFLKEITSFFGDTAGRFRATGKHSLPVNVATGQADRG